MKDSSTNRRIGSMLSIIQMFVSLLIGLIYTPLLIRYLGDSEYGVYTLAMSLIAYLSVLDMGFGNALVRFTARNRAQGKNENNLIGMFLIFYLVISIIAAIVGIIILMNIEQFFSSSFSEIESNTLKTVFCILLCNTIIAFPASVFSSVIRSHERFIWANSINLINNILNHLVMIILLINGYKSISLACVSLISTIMVLIFNLYYCFRVIGIRLGFKRFDKSFYQELVYSLFILINIVVDQLYASTDKVILGKLCGSVAVAIYGVGVTFQSYFTQFSTSISSVFLPHVSKLSVKDNGIEEMSATFLKVGHVQLVLLSLIGIGFAVYGRIFIELWVGSNYREAYSIALLVMIPALIPLSQNIGISILQALNKHRIRSLMYFCIAVINVVLSIPLAMKFGGIGAAMGTAIGNLLGQIMFMNWFYWKRIGIDIPTYWRNFFVLIFKLIPVVIVFFFT